MCLWFTLLLSSPFRVLAHCLPRDQEYTKGFLLPDQGWSKAGFWLQSLAHKFPMLLPTQSPGARLLPALSVTEVCGLSTHCRPGQLSLCEYMQQMAFSGLTISLSGKSCLPLSPPLLGRRTVTPPTPLCSQPVLRNIPSPVGVRAKYPGEPRAREDDQRRAKIQGEGGENPSPRSESLHPRGGLTPCWLLSTEPPSTKQTLRKAERWHRLSPDQAAPAAGHSAGHPITRTPSRSAENRTCPF